MQSLARGLPEGSAIRDFITEHLRFMLDQREQQFRLIWKMAVKRPLANIGGVSDGRHGDTADAMLIEQAAGSTENQFVITNRICARFAGGVI
jgi:hypothetical protein